MRDLLTDGAGFIGSHIAERLLVRGPEVAVADDPSTGNDENVPERRRDFYEMDIRSGCAEALGTSNPRCSRTRPPRWTPGAPCASRPSTLDVNVLGRTVCPLRKRAEHGRGEGRL